MNKKGYYSLLEFGLLAIVLICIFVIGWFGNDIYRDYNNKRLYDGLWLPARNKTAALETVYNFDEIGEWVCVNIKDMDYKRCVEVAQHECGHELWAEICEKDNEFCEKGQNMINEYKNQ